METPTATDEADRPRRKPPVRGKAGGRTVIRSLRLSTAEAAEAEARAQAAGVSFNAFAVTAMLGDSGPKRRRRPTVDRAALGAALAELNRVGNNVNQIARALNRGREAEAAEATLQELRTVLDQVTAALRR